jgi:hypothetical protein
LNIACIASLALSSIDCVSFVSLTECFGNAMCTKNLAGFGSLIILFCVCRIWDDKINNDDYDDDVDVNRWTSTGSGLAVSRLTTGIMSADLSPACVFMLRSSQKYQCF